LLLSTGAAVEEFSTQNTAVGHDLKNTLAVAHSKIPVDAKKEFGLS